MLVVSCVVLVSAVVGAILIWPRGNDDGHVASGPPANARRVKVVIAGTNDAKEEVTDGGIAGEGTFKATGAIDDRGTVTAYRGLSPTSDAVILLRFVTKGGSGGITYMVIIDTRRRPVIPRWWIQSGTGAYKGLHGGGHESENATYTVSTLRGKVWR